MNELEKKIRESLLQFAGRCGVEINDLRDDTRPIPDLGMDSPDGIDWACQLEELGVKLPADLNPLVVDKPKRRPRTLAEIVTICFEYSRPTT